MHVTVFQNGVESFIVPTLNLHSDYTIHTDIKFTLVYMMMVPSAVIESGTGLLSYSFSIMPFFRTNFV